MANMDLRLLTETFNKTRKNEYDTREPIKIKIKAMAPQGNVSQMGST